MKKFKIFSIIAMKTVIAASLGLTGCTKDACLEKKQDAC
ncbi:MAG: hypothetical protein AUK63_1981 [bacterium P3]|nr:MAG: hypothetical protein AUK63_1981 [bacterium P3]KWW34141.1 MAG: hypothetical protein F083_2478 [bacterium F083]